MSDNYKIIRKTKEYASELVSEGWTNKKIHEFIGITPKLLNEILLFDPVSITIQRVTVDKLRSFVRKRDKEKAERLSGGVMRIASKPEPAVEEVVEKEEVIIKRSVRYTITGVEMDLLDEVIKLFAKKGYQLGIQITKIYKPDGSR